MIFKFFICFIFRVNCRDTIRDEELVIAKSEFEEDLTGFEIDDQDFPQSVLDELEQSGINISGFSVAIAFDGTDQRAVLAYEKNWFEKTPEGKIAVPYSFHAKLERKYEFRQWFDNMNKDLGCVELVFVPEEELLRTSYEFGILITNTKFLPDDDWCKSTFGIVPGYTSGNGEVTQYGVKPTWQLLLMADGCTKQSTAQHEMMHALGFKHEHVRPDRDEYLDVDEEYILENNPSSHHNYRKLSHGYWLNSPFPLELRSVMMYSGKSYMTTKNGKTWASQIIRLTSTDALQIQWLYCKRTDQNYEYTPHSDCQSDDVLDQRQSVLDHRICDGIQDCPGGEDENGTLKECKKQEAKTEAGCCKYLKAMDRNEIINCEAQGNYGGRDFYTCHSSKTGFYSSSLFWEPSTVFGRSAWVMGYESCTNLTEYCIKSTSEVDQTCPPSGGYNPNLPQYLLDSGFMANVYCSDESAICTSKEFDENSIKNLEDLQIKIGSSSLQYHIQNKIMKVVRMAIALGSKNVKKCARDGSPDYIPDALSGPNCGLDITGDNLIENIGMICTHYEDYLIFRHQNCRLNKLRRLGRLRNRCKAFIKHKKRWSRKQK